MAWTTPGTAVAGDVLTAAFWNLQVRDNFNDHESRFKSYGTAVTKTSNTNSTATTFAAASNVFASNLTFVADGTSSYVVEFNSPLVYINSAAQVVVSLGNSGTELGIMGLAVLGTNTGIPFNCRFLWTPTAATYVLNMRFYLSGAGPTATIYGGTGTGGAGTYMPAYLRVTGAG